MSDKRKVRFEGVEEGPFDLQKIMRMRERGELGNTAEFWSLRDKAWKPIVAMMTDFEVYDDDRLRCVKLESSEFGCSHLAAMIAQSARLWLTKSSRLMKRPRSRRKVVHASLGAGLSCSRSRQNELA
jgi:hypothetical protein